MLCLMKQGRLWEKIGGGTMPTKTVELVSNCYVVLIFCKNDKRIRAVN